MELLWRHRQVFACIEVFGCFRGRSLFYRLAKLPVIGDRALLRLKKAMTLVGFSKHLETDEILRMLELWSIFDLKITQHK